MPPRTQERAFRVRHVECDAHGVLTATNMLRYMQEAAMDASTAAGYSVAWYNEHARMWLIRETDLAITRWPRMDETLTITTWVADFRRVRSRRAYDLRCNGASVARAYTDWVYLDTGTLRPVTVPDEMLTGFWPDGPPADELPPRAPFPADDEPAADVFRVTRPVLWSDLDQAAHVNNAQYLAMMEDCAATAPNSGVLAPDPASDAPPAPRRCRIQYREPAVLGDMLRVATWITPGADRPARRYTVTRAGDHVLLAQAHVTALS